MIGPNVTNILGQPIAFAPGTWQTKNVIYLVTCRLCLKPYIGRTTQQLRNRMCGHRECFYQVLKDHSDVDLQSDDYTLGLHLADEHGCIDSNDFNKHYNVQILENPRLFRTCSHSPPFNRSVSQCHERNRKILQGIRFLLNNYFFDFLTIKFSNSKFKFQRSKFQKKFPDRF